MKNLAWQRPDRFRPWLAVALGSVLTGCAGGSTTSVAVPNGSEGSARTGTAQAGSVSNSVPIGLSFREQSLPFRYMRGETGAAWPVEVTGGGVGMLDYDDDGDLDLFFCQGGTLRPGGGVGSEGEADVLLRNDGCGRFVNVSTEAGLIPRGYGQGVVVADYDGDGDPDVYVTRYGKNTLWRNDRGRFTDATDHAGVGVNRWSLGAAFFDADGDGDLDLFVANYFDFDPAQAPFEHDDETGAAEYGPPGHFKGQPDVLFRNDGHGQFTDVTDRAGVAGSGRGMGCLAADFDRDGRVDVLVANDAEANALWHNRGDGTFEDVAEAWGLAFNGQGQPEANMGIAHADLDGDALLDVAITHFVSEHTTLWRQNLAPGAQPFYEDMTVEAGIASDSRTVTGWGVALVDFDRDGWPDLVQSNGHIRRERGQAYGRENPPRLWRNEGEGRFREAGVEAGRYFQTLHDGRGLAAGDLDGDGDLDLVIVHHHAPAVVLWNETPARGSALILRLRGMGNNRDAIGARVTVKTGGRTRVATLDGGGGYLGTGDPNVHVGLGPVRRAERVEVRWPSGRVESRTGLPADTVIDWNEGDCHPNANGR